MHWSKSTMPKLLTSRWRCVCLPHTHPSRERSLSPLEGLLSVVRKGLLSRSIRSNLPPPPLEHLPITCLTIASLQSHTGPTRTSVSVGFALHAGQSLCCNVVLLALVLMSIRFRGVVVLAGTLVSLLVALAAGGALAWHLFGFLAVILVIVGYSQLGPLSAVVVTRQLAPGPYYAGSWLDVSLTVSGTRWPWLHLTMVDSIKSSNNESEHRFVLTTVGRTRQNLQYRLTDLQRGPLEFGQITVATSDFFGFFERSITLEDELIHLRVWPRVQALSKSELNNYLWHGDQLNSSRTRAELTHLQGIREYVPGDRLSHVHWKTTAHTGDFKVKYFEPENKAEFIVLLDASHHFTANDWELAVSIAASLVLRASRSQLLLRVVALDQPIHQAPPAVGPETLNMAMDFLSDLGHRTSGTADAIEPTRFGQHMLVIITQERREAWRGLADSIVVVGSGGTTSLGDWRASIARTPMRASVVR